MERKMSVVQEQPVFYCSGECPQFGQEIKIYADDLKKAPIGTEWKCEDQDRYPNASMYWNIYVKKVFEDEHGCLLIKRDDYYETYRGQGAYYELPELIWVEYRGR